MGTINDYIAWRGDLSFKVSGFNHIDSLILCQIFYAEIDAIVSEFFSKPVKLSRVSDLYFSKKLHKKNLGVLINPRTPDLLKMAAKSERFKDVRFCGLVNNIDEESTTQFAALTAILPTGEACIVYKGTDDTLVGWKESFNLCLPDSVPGQVQAVAYLDEVCKKHWKQIYVCGHSKGGNLAVYASTFCNKKSKKRIVSVFDNDGPGFIGNILLSPEYKSIVNKVHSVVPDSSVVGGLLERSYIPTYIESSETSGIRQHDIFTWQLEGTCFKIVAKQSLTGELSSKTVKDWLQEVDVEQRKDFIDGLFSVLEVTGSKTLLDLEKNGIQHSVVVIKELSKLDKETKDRVYNIIKIFFKALQVNLPSLKDFIKNVK